MKLSRAEAGVLAVTLFVLLAAAVPAVIQGVTRFPPFFSSTMVWDSTSGGQAGGQVLLFKAKAQDSLRLGDVVYLSAENEVAVSSTLAAYNTLAGVVVGGSRQSNLGAISSVDEVGTLAAMTSGTPEYVWVLKQGRTWVRTDADAGVTFGNQVIPSNGLAGRVEARSTAIDTFNRVLGRAVQTVVSGTPVMLDVSIP